MLEEKQMSFFEELLDSYKLLKERRLKIILTEEASNLPTYSKLVARKDDQAQAAVQATDAEIAAVFGKPVPDKVQPTVNIAAAVTIKIAQCGIQNTVASGTEPSRYCWEGQTGASPFIKQLDTGFDINKQQFGEYRTALARMFLQAGVQGMAGQEGMSVNDPAVAEFLSSETGSILGKKFPDAIPMFIGLKDNLDTLGLKGLAGERNNSLLKKVINSIDNGESTAVKLSSLVDTTLEEAYPGQDEILRAVETFKDATETFIKFKNKEALTYDELESLKDNLTIVKDRKGRTKLFVKSGTDDLGVSFDWKGDSEMKDLLEDFDQYMRNRADDEDEEYEELAIPRVDRQVILDKSDKNIASNKVITEVSEEVDSIFTLFYRGRSKEGAQKYKELYDRWGDSVTKALGVVDAVESGDLVATKDTEFLAESMDFLEAEYKNSFESLVKKLAVSRVNQIKKNDADMIWRVGGMAGAGQDGKKADQVLIYNDCDKAKKIQGAKAVRQTTLGEAIPSKDWGGFTKSWGSQDKNSSVCVVDESLKYTVAGGKIGMGLQPSPDKVVKRFLDPKSFTRKMLTALEVPQEERGAVEDNFKTLDSLLGNVDTIFDAESTTMNQNTVLRTIGASLEPYLESMDIDKDEFVELAAGAVGKIGKDTTRQSIRQKIHRGVLVNMINSGVNNPDGAVAKSWRRAAAVFIYRGAYDSNNAYDSIEDLSTGKSYRHSRNGLLKSKVAPFIETGEGWTAAKSGFNINGFGYSVGLARKEGGSNNASVRMNRSVYSGSMNESLEHLKTSDEHLKLLEEYNRIQTKVFAALFNKE